MPPYSYGQNNYEKIILFSREEKLEQQKKAKRSKYKRFALIGLATVTGGTLIGILLFLNFSGFSPIL